MMLKARAESLVDTSTPRNRTRAPYARCAAASSGASPRQGPHHDAQTFTTTGVPRSSPSACS
jgi:hypothetical protein